MRHLLATLVLLGVGGQLPAQEGLKKIRLQDPQLEHSKDRESARLCFQAQAGNPGSSPCNFVTRFSDEHLDGTLIIKVSQICATIHESATLTGDIWYVALEQRPERPLYRIDCGASRAHEFTQASAAPQPAPARQPPAPGPPNPRDSRSPPASGSDPDSITRRLEAIEGRLQSLEGLSGLAGVIRGQRGLEEKLDDFRRELLEKAEAGAELGCVRADSIYGGRREVMVSVGGGVLRFLEIRTAAEPVAVGLTEEKAQELLREAQQGVEDPIFPHLFLAVPAVTRPVGPFFLQDRLIDPGLYARVTGGGDARRVSHRDARRVIDQLNAACAGVARLALPTEEQLVVAAHLLYNPVQNGLKPCAAVAAAGAEIGLTELLGHAWHLTGSPCERFGNATAPSCDEGSYIRKGGTASSVNPLECVPEYRSTAAENVAQKETSFRLVLLE